MYQVSMLGEPWKDISKAEVMMTLAKAKLDVAESLQKLESGEKVTIAFVAFRKRPEKQTEAAQCEST